MEEIGGGPVGTFEDFEVVCIEANMSTARFVQLIDMPERTWRRWQGKARHDRHPKDPVSSVAATGPRGRPGSGDQSCVGQASVGHRKIWALIRHDGRLVLQAGVLRILRDEGLLQTAQYQRTVP